MVKNFYTVFEFQQVVGCISLTAVYASIRAGEIPSRRLASKILIPAAFVNEFLSTNSTANDTKAV